MSELSDLELLDALGVDATPEKKVTRTPREERIIAGFEEIQKFYADNGRVPEHGEDRDIFERLYATRLDQIRKSDECRVLVQDLDHQGLLHVSDADNAATEDIADDALLDALGVDVEPSTSPHDLTKLQHVKPRAVIQAERQAAEEVATRTKCEDFETFKPIFDRISVDMKSGIRETRPYQDDGSVEKGNVFILDGLVAYVADVGEEIRAPNGQWDARLRVIFSNKTESDMLRRSLQRALNKDSLSRRITDPSAGPLFDNTIDDDDKNSGTIYVLRSKSHLPIVQQNREVLHKIGVTGGSVERRIANAVHDATYLLADVEVVATYQLFNINRTKLENLIHKFFASARLDIGIKDRFGQPVQPREWFLVPLYAIDQAVEHIKDGTIDQYRYDPLNAALVSLPD